MKLENFLKNKTKPYVIAEVSQNHDGSLGQAHAFIDAVADAGADAIKFQTHIAAEESTKWEEFRVKFSFEDKTRYDYWKRMEFTREQWKGLYNHATERKLDFLSSPFSLKAFYMLDEIGIPAWKFGAGEIFNNTLLNAAVKTGKPILISTGLSTWDDIDEVVKKTKKNGNELILFQCVTAYPSTENMIDIGLIEAFRNRYNCVIGISDHSSTIYPALAAVTLGAMMVEVHVTMSKYMFGPDVKASVSLEELRTVVEGTQFIYKMKQVKTDLSKRNNDREKLKLLFSKSYFYAHDMKCGEIISESDIMLKKPNIGLAEEQLGSIIGKKLKTDVLTDNVIKEEDLEDE